MWQGCSQKLRTPDALKWGVVCGPGGRYNTMPDERVDIPDYLDMIRIYLLTILEICGAPR
jgi:acetylornithine deacetylase/succinyl-diaminopimelate desuccinylase-like protein